METAVAKREQVALAPNTEQMAVIHSSICPNHTDLQISFFLEYCRVKQIDPFSKMIYSVVRKTRLGDRQTFQTSIDYMRAQAETTGKYAGQVGPYWCGEDGTWRDVWLSDKPPVACKIGILRKDFAEPLYAIALWREYKPEEDWAWRKMPSLMLAKVCESLGLRKAFPERMSGLYSDDEMAQAEKATPRVKESKGHLYVQEHQGQEVTEHDFLHKSHEYCNLCSTKWTAMSDAERNEAMGVKTPKPEKHDKPISAAQLKRFWTVAASAGWSQEEAHAMILEKYHLDSAAKISVGIYDEVIRILENKVFPPSGGAGSADQINREIGTRVEAARPSPQTRTQGTADQSSPPPQTEGYAPSREEKGATPPAAPLKFLPSMKELMTKDKETYWKALGQAGYTSTIEVPLSDQPRVLKAVTDAIMERDAMRQG